jgi:hypothetical protein
MHDWLKSWPALALACGLPLDKEGRPLIALIITHKFLESLVERIAKAEITRRLLNTTWLVTIARKNVPKDMGNDKFIFS